jgi:Ni/Co efflux regulator RcnB
MPRMTRLLLLVALVVATATTAASTPTTARAHESWKTCRSGILNSGWTPSVGAFRLRAGQAIHVAVHNNWIFGLAVSVYARNHQLPPGGWRHKAMWIPPGGNRNVHFDYFAPTPVYWEVMFYTPANSLVAGWRIRSYRCG